LTNTCRSSTVECFWQAPNPASQKRCLPSASALPNGVGPRLPFSQGYVSCCCCHPTAACSSTHTATPPLLSNLACIYPLHKRTVTVLQTCMSSTVRFWHVRKSKDPVKLFALSISALSLLLPTGQNCSPDSVPLKKLNSRSNCRSSVRPERSGTVPDMSAHQDSRTGHSTAQRVSSNLATTYEDVRKVRLPHAS
jgi:hypothetical protein